MLAAVILAAGRSKRMGCPKLLLSWHDDKTILDTTISHLRATTVEHSFLVTGAYQHQVTAIAAQYAMHTVHNHDYLKGEMLSSLKIAIRSLPPQTAALLVMMGDMPLINSETINTVIKAHKPKHITAPTAMGMRGHPVIFDQMFFQPILSLPETETPRTILRRHRAALSVVPIDDDAVLVDIDSPEDYEMYRPNGSSPLQLAGII